MAHPKTETKEKVKPKTQDEVTEPPMYKVLLFNDDYTSMEFVVEVLVFVFNKSTEDAVNIMLNVHRRGIGLCGVYTYEVAESKVEKVYALARENSFPLKCTMERE